MQDVARSRFREARNERAEVGDRSFEGTGDRHGRGFSSLRATTARDAHRRTRAVILARLLVTGARLCNDQGVDTGGTESQQGDDDCEGEAPHSASVALARSTAFCLSFANIPMAVRITSRTKRSVGLPTTLPTRLHTELRRGTARGPSTRGQMHSHCRQSQKALSARTKESRREHREAGCNGRVPRRVTAAALARSCMVRKVMLAETHAEGRRLERTPPIDARPVNGGARRIDRWSWAKRQVRSVDDDVFVVRIREHYRRDKCLVTEVVREECTPGL